MQKLLKAESSNLLQQIFRFSTVGVGNFLVDIAIFNVLIFFMSPVTSMYSFVLIRIAAGGCAMIHSYFWNRKWVFKHTHTPYKTAPLFLAVSLIGLGIHTVLSAFLFLFFAKNFLLDTWILANIAFIISVVASMSWNYIMYNRLVFKSKTNFN